MLFMPLRPALRQLLLPALLGLAAAVQAQGQADLVAYTEQWPPYNYEEQGQVKGFATELLRALCKEARLVCEIRLVPWARAMAHVRREPNSLIYSTARRPDREKQFIWVGPLAPRITWLWGRAGAEPLPHDARELPQYRFGVVRGEAAVQDLQAHGVPASSLAQDVSNAAVLKMLLSGWVDMVVDTELGMAWNLRLTQQPGTEVRRLFKLSDEGGFYYALNPHSEPTRVQALQAAFEKLRRNGQLDALLRPYLRPAHEAHKPATPGTTDDSSRP